MIGQCRAEWQTMAVTLKVLDGEIEIPEGYAEFLKLRRHYASVADTVRRDAANAISDGDFCEALKLSETYGEVDVRYGASRWGRRFYRKWIDPIIEDALERFRSHRCYEIDAERFEDEYLDDAAVSDCFRKWAKEGGIISQIVEAENYREEERRTRVESALGRWRGGGFGGIKTAIKGAIQAQAMNYAEAAVVGVLNKFKRSKTQRATIELSIRAFQQYQMELIDAIHETVVGFAESVAKAFNDLVGNNVTYETIWNGGSERRRNAMFANLREGNVPKSDRKSIALEILRANPLDEDIYKWIYDNFSDERENVDAFAKFFCVDIDKDENRRQE